MKNKENIDKINFWYYLLPASIFLLISLISKASDSNWEFFKKYALISCITSYFIGKLLNYLKKESTKKFDEIVGFGAISASEIVLGNILLVYPSYLKLFYTFKALGSLVVGIGADSLKRKTALYITLIVLAIFSLSSFNPKLFYSVITLPISLVIIGLFGDSSIPGRVLVLDAHIHELSKSRTKDRLLMAKSVEFESLVWIWIGALSYTFDLPIKYFLIVGSLLSIVLIFLSKFVTDKTHPEKTHKGVKGIIKELKILFLIGVVFYLFLIYTSSIEVSFFTIFFNIEKSLPSLHEKSTSTLSWAIPMYLGCTLHQKLLKNTLERKLITLGLAISIVGLLVCIITYYMSHEFTIKTFYLISFGIMGLGSGIFLPCFYSVATSFRGIHFFGVLVGLVDLIRTLGEWFGSLTTNVNKQSIILLYVTCLIAFLIIIFLFNRLLKKKERNNSLEKDGLEKSR